MNPLCEAAELQTPSEEDNEIFEGECKRLEVELKRFNEMNIVGRQARDVVTGKEVKLKDTYKFAGKTVTILEVL